VRRNDIVRAYDLGVMRREEARLRAESIPAVNHSRAEFIEVNIPEVALATSQTISKLSLPRQAVLVSIRRGSELIIPHGDTQLKAGDIVTALCERDCTGKVREVLTAIE
jgi:chloride channel protein, CIC family